jgi:hypothetical protein
MLTRLGNYLSTHFIRRSRTKGTIALAEEEGGRYFSCRSDSFWRALHTCDNKNILNALATTHLALAFPETDLGTRIYTQLNAGVRTCTQLGTKPDFTRKIEFDSCFSISHSPNNTGQNGNNAMANCIANDINERGAVCFAEMQQRKQTKQKAKVTNAAEAEEGVDILPDRLGDYASFAVARDHGKPSGKSGDVRAGKIATDVTSRSVVGIAYYCYDGIATCKHSASSHAVNLLGRMNQARGDVLAMISLGRELNREKLLGAAIQSAVENPNGDITEEYKKIVLGKVKALQKSVRNHLVGASNGIKKLVSEVMTVFSMSHLFTKAIVGGFLPVVQKMCEILEVNMDNITKVGLSDEQVKELFGVSEVKAKLEQAQARANNLEARANNLEARARDLEAENIRLREYMRNRNIALPVLPSSAPISAEGSPSKNAHTPLDKREAGQLSAGESQAKSKRSHNENDTPNTDQPTAKQPGAFPRRA